MQPILITHLLPLIERELIHLLSELTEEEWQTPTIAGQWTVKDVATHLLDGNLRSLSMLRDGYFDSNGPKGSRYDDMLEYLNGLNHDWVRATSRLSPEVLVDLLSSSGREYCEFLSSLDPFQQATFSVAWAGEEESLNWFHIAREYTEKWHHQQQIRLALGKDDVLLADKWYLPYLETSVRALPHHYRAVKGKSGDVLQLHIGDGSTKAWYLQWNNGVWDLKNGTAEAYSSFVQVPDEIAWRVFTKGIDKNEALERSTLKGPNTLSEHLFSLTAVMA